MRLPNEELLEVAAGNEVGTSSAAVIRGGDGFLVLETARVVIVDLDLVAPPARTRTTIFSVFLGATAPRPRSAAVEPSRRVRDWIEADAARGVRVYRTAGGLRYLITHTTFDPMASETDSLLALLGSDPSSRQLCRDQLGFRARLTPEPGRVGVEAAPPRSPLGDERARRMFDSWLARYDTACAGYATCALLTELGRGVCHPEIEPIVTLHDQRTRAASGLPLA